MAITCGLVAYLLGEAVSGRVSLLRRRNIPDPVTGGLVLAFRFLGRDCQAAVLTAGDASFVIRATPTAISTMTAVTKRYGPCQHAFIVLPLVSAVSVDLANALVTQGFLDLFAR